MSFSVEPGALERAASLINDASNDAQTARAYMLKHTDMQFDNQGLLNKAWQAHGNLVDEMTKRLTHLVDLLQKSRNALQATANYYRHTDTGNAARLDATYPSVDRSGYELPGGRPLSGNMP
ncbi:WXG100 family type VII secretion target [Micromonospora sp. NPDC005205]|uniref:type VII secretion target n=1 Tax=Micromonospora sp. NPDC005205 TaxID=3156714 RepID=UPI0033B73AA6